MDDVKVYTLSFAYGVARFISSATRLQKALDQLEIPHGSDRKKTLSQQIKLAILKSVVSLDFHSRS